MLGRPQGERYSHIPSGCTGGGLGGSGSGGGAGAGGAGLGGNGPSGIDAPLQNRFYCIGLP
jgi:hypothetical protein